MKQNQEQQRVDRLRSAGIAVCTLDCAACSRKICTGAKAIQSEGVK